MSVLLYTIVAEKKETSKMKSTTKKIAITALMAALTCIATIIIKIPSPLKGYLNLGDCMVLISGWILSPVYGFIAAGLGSALADIFSGYVIYAPATFVIKGLMAITAYYCFKLLARSLWNLPSRIISGILAEIVMVSGYLIFEGILYGFVPSLVNVIPNCIQGVAGIIIGVVWIKVLQKPLSNYLDNIND